MPCHAIPSPTYLADIHYRGLDHRVFCFGPRDVALLLLVLPWLFTRRMRNCDEIQRTADTHTQYEARMHWGRFRCRPCRGRAYLLPVTRYQRCRIRSGLEMAQSSSPLHLLGSSQGLMSPNYAAPPIARARDALGGLIPHSRWLVWGVQFSMTDLRSQIVKQVPR